MVSGAMPKVQNVTDKHTDGTAVAGILMRSFLFEQNTLSANFTVPSEV